MSGIYKIVVGERVEFDVKFSLNDAGEEKHFGMRLTARRQALTEQERVLGDQITVQQFLADRDVKMTAWLLDKPPLQKVPPLQDADGAPVPPGADALQFLMREVGGVASLVFAAYLRANGAQGAAGN